MALFREATQVFIVRIWREPREIDGARPQWRGAIEHVSTGQRRYVLSLNELVAFIKPFLWGICSPADEADEIHNDI